MQSLSIWTNMFFFLCEIYLPDVYQEYVKRYMEDYEWIEIKNY